MSQPAADRPRDGIRVVKNPITPLGFKEVMIATYTATISMTAQNMMRSVHAPTTHMTDPLTADLESPLLLLVVYSIKEVNDTRKNNNEMYNIVIVNVSDTLTNNK